jgi:hypothetical protein
MKKIEYKYGSELRPEVQQDCLQRFVHRFTGDHHPLWARAKRPDGTDYPLQFKDDADWLAHTTFAVKADGTLHNGVKTCNSAPTWPNNPELRQSFSERGGLHESNEVQP